MFTKKDKEPTALQKTIDVLHDRMLAADPSSKEYAQMADQLVKLYPLIPETEPKRVSPDTWALIGANLAGILIIISYERVNVITTKAIGFLTKLR